MSVPNQVIVSPDSPNQVTIVAFSGQFVLTSRHVHTQSTASDTWTINHTLGGKPSVTIVDSADTTVFGEVQYVSNSEVTVSFSAPFSGYAYLT
jgi:hypothetical protein